MSTSMQLTTTYTTPYTSNRLNKATNFTPLKI